MTMAASQPLVTVARLARLFRTPKGLLILLLAALVAIAAWGPEARLAALDVAVAVTVASLLDAPIIRFREGAWAFPDGALLTGLIIAMILSPQEPWHVVAITTALGIASKYAFRSRSANIFNPAALALVATFYVFDTAQNWWGALGDLGWPALTVLFAAGLFITDRVNKTPAVLSFLGVYYLLITTTAFFGDPGRVAELYRTPDLNAALFFAFFMITDPPTSPPRHRDQLVFGAITAVVSFAVFEWVGAAYFLLAGLLVANAWEAWRRTRVSRRRQVQRSV